MYRAINLKIEHEEIINELEHIHNIFLQEYNEIIQNNIKLSDFTEDEYAHETRGKFEQKLGLLLNKNYLNWNLENRAKYFRMFALHLRQDFKSLKYKQDISSLLSQYEFNLNNEQKTELRNKLRELNLYPTQQEIKNICRSGIVTQIPVERNSIPLDFNLGQDKQTIIQSDKNKPKYEVKLNGIWFKLDLINQIPEYIKNKNITKYCKPKFVKNEDGNWLVIVTVKIKQIKTKLDKSLICGVDIGVKNAYNAIVLKENKNFNESYKSNESDESNESNDSLKSKEQEQSYNESNELKIKTLPLTCSKETKKINEKLCRVKNNLTNVYKRLRVYSNIIKNNYSPTFTEQIKIKHEILSTEKKRLLNKRKELNKRKSYLAARDLIKQLLFYKVKNVHLESLNWVDNTGGGWDFSQQQDIFTNKCEEYGIRVIKVNAAKTSSQNPFSPVKKYGEKLFNRNVRFKNKKYQIDRDVLASINIALRQLKKDTIETTRYVNPNTNRRYFSVITSHVSSVDNKTVNMKNKYKTYKITNNNKVKHQTTTQSL
jgi:hypothetical protein